MKISFLHELAKESSLRRTAYTQHAKSLNRHYLTDIILSVCPKSHRLLRNTEVLLTSLQQLTTGRYFIQPHVRILFLKEPFQYNTST